MIVACRVRTGCKSRVGNSRAFAGDLHAFGFLLIRGSNIVYVSIFERGGAIGEVNGKLVDRHFPSLEELQRQTSDPR